MSGIVSKKRAGSQIATPPTGYVTTFVDTDGVMKIKDEAGNVTTYATSDDVGGGAAPIVNSGTLYVKENSQLGMFVNLTNDGDILLDGYLIEVI